MIEEGFGEEDMIAALAGAGRIVEDYPDDCRCLIVGYFMGTGPRPCPLHMVCDYSSHEVVDIVTAYVPQRPWWVTPTKRGRTQ